MAETDGATTTSDVLEVTTGTGVLELFDGQQLFGTRHLSLSTMWSKLTRQQGLCKAW